MSRRNSEVEAVVAIVNGGGAVELRRVLLTFPATTAFTVRINVAFAHQNHTRDTGKPTTSQQPWTEFTPKSLLTGRLLYARTCQSLQTEQGRVELSSRLQEPLGHRSRKTWLRSRYSHRLNHRRCQIPNPRLDRPDSGTTLISPNRDIPGRRQPRRAPHASTREAFRPFLRRNMLGKLWCRRPRKDRGCAMSGTG
jgi:hypothetical protein